MTVVVYRSPVPVKLGHCCDSNDFDRRMPAVPQAAFAACKVRQREMVIAKCPPPEQDQQKFYYDRYYTELSPLKYNSKLMNSIWGLYNRYSVHNFKKITDAGAAPDLAPAAVSKGQAKSPQLLVSDWIEFWGTQKSSC